MTKATIDSKVVDRKLREAVWPVLKAVGFRRTGRTAWRDRPDAIQVVNIQSFNAYLADAIGVTTFSFAVNLGVFYPAIARLSAIGSFIKDPTRPAEYVCQARLHLVKLHAQPLEPPSRRLLGLRAAVSPDSRRRDRPDVWYVRPDGSNATEAAADAGEQILRVGIPWLEQLADLPEARRRFQEVISVDAGPDRPSEDYGGGLGSPNRWLAIGALSVALGDVAGAAWAAEEMGALEYFQERRAELDAVRAAIDGIRPPPD